jgi:predicted chitinase
LDKTLHSTPRRPIEILVGQLCAEFVYFKAAFLHGLGRTATHPANVKMIAILAYANRMGNKGEDGWTYRGRGPIQITGRNNYAEVGEAIGVDLLNDPGRLLEPEVGSDAAAYLWKTSGCNALADDGDFVAITRAISGGVIGLDDRERLWQCARNAFCC